jgi:hypothetical protein
MKQYICEHCHQTFSRRGTKTPRYCSRECHDNARRKYPDIPCVQCGTVFQPKFASHAHCSEICAHKTTQEKLSRKVIRTCQHCNQEFECSPAFSESKFCSQDCYYKAKQVTQERACDYCGKVYLPRAARSDRGCCSRECAFALAEVQRPDKTVECAYCGDKFTPHSDKQRYCSKECGNIARRTKSYGRKRRTENFSPVRKEAIRARDGYCCVACGSDDRIQVDHILCVELGGKSTIDNGQTLCHDCHVKKTTYDKWLIRENRRLPKL